MAWVVECGYLITPASPASGISRYGSEIKLDMAAIDKGVGKVVSSIEGLGSCLFGFRPVASTCGPISSISMNRSYGIAVRADGTSLEWGEGISGECCEDEHRDDPRMLRVHRCFDRISLVAVACGGGHVVVAVNGRGALSWGSLSHDDALSRNRRQILGLGRCCDSVRCHGCVDHIPFEAAPSNVGRAYWVRGLEDVQVVALSCGETTSAALCDRGLLFSWGIGETGELGLGGQLPVSCSPRKIEFPDHGVVAVSIASGPYHSAVVCENGRLYTHGQVSLYLHDASITNSFRCGQKDAVVVGNLAMVTCATSGRPD